MRLSISIVAIMLSTASMAVASPVTSEPLIGRGMASKVAGVGQCPTDCWNQAAVSAKCDPNKSDTCLCGPFFDAVTDCTSEQCSAADNLAALATLQPACS